MRHVEQPSGRFHQHLLVRCQSDSHNNNNDNNNIGNYYKPSVPINLQKGCPANLACPQNGDPEQQQQQQQQQQAEQPRQHDWECARLILV